MSSRPPSDPRRLDQIQRWLQVVIMHPDGVEAGIDSDAATSEIELTAGQVDGFIQPSSRRTSIERLEVYGHAYYARLIECLRDEFPALVHAVGQEVFDGLAFGYLQSDPSTSYTLTHLGAKFPAYLEKTRPTDEGGLDDPSWPDFMIDLAHLERTYSEVFDGPGLETEEPLRADQLLGISPDRWPEAKLLLAPCLRVLSLHFPVHEYATAVRKEEDPSFPEPRPTWLAVSRIAYVVRRWPLSRVQFDLLESLIAGETVAVAIQRGATSAAAQGAEMDDLAASLRDWFAEWTASGFVRAIELPARH
jgi:hypothetical protein